MLMRLTVPGLPERMARPLVALSLWELVRVAPPESPKSPAELEGSSTPDGPNGIGGH